MRNDNKHIGFFYKVLLFLFTLTSIAGFNTIPIQARSRSNCVNTYIGGSLTNACPTNLDGSNPSGGPGGGPGGPGATGNAIADYALSLAAAIKANCPPINYPIRGYALVNRSTEGCLDKIPGHTSLANITNVIKLLHISVDTSNGNLQCVGFVQGVAIGIGAPLPNGDAGSFNHNEPGYQWYPAGAASMQIGDIVVWSTHIAVVVKQPTANKDFTVAEANGGSGTVGIETYPYGNNPYGSGLVYYGFLRKAGGQSPFGLVK